MSMRQRSVKMPVPNVMLGVLMATEKGHGDIAALLAKTVSILQGHEKYKLYPL